MAANSLHAAVASGRDARPHNQENLAITCCLINPWLILNDLFLAGFYYTFKYNLIPGP